MFTKIKTICESDNRTKLKAYTTLKNNIYIYRETYVNKKFYIVNKNYDVVINSNKHNY